VNLMGSVGCVTTLVLGFAPRAFAGDANKVTWHNDVTTAWKASQENRRPLLVFVTKDHCFYCVQMKQRTYSDAYVAGTISGSFVPLVLDGAGNSPLLKDLRVTSYPSTFVISPEAVILDRIDGFVPPDAFASRLNAFRPRIPVAQVTKEP
jgi:thioredoxin-related protein